MRRRFVHAGCTLFLNYPFLHFLVHTHKPLRKHSQTSALCGAYALIAHCTRSRRLDGALPGPYKTTCNCNKVNKKAAPSLQGPHAAKDVMQKKHKKQQQSVRKFRDKRELKIIMLPQHLSVCSWTRTPCRRVIKHSTAVFIIEHFCFVFVLLHAHYFYQHRTETSRASAHNKHFASFNVTEQAVVCGAAQCSKEQKHKAKRQK